MLPTVYGKKIRGGETFVLSIKLFNKRNDSLYDMYSNSLYDMYSKNIQDYAKRVMIDRNPRERLKGLEQMKMECAAPSK